MDARPPRETTGSVRSRPARPPVLPCFKFGHCLAAWADGLHYEGSEFSYVHDIEDARFFVGDEPCFVNGGFKSSGDELLFPDRFSDKRSLARFADDLEG